MLTFQEGIWTSTHKAGNLLRVDVGQARSQGAKRSNSESYPFNYSVTKYQSREKCRLTFDKNSLTLNIKRTWTIFMLLRLSPNGMKVSNDVPSHSARFLSICKNLSYVNRFFSTLYWYKIPFGFLADLLESWPLVRWMVYKIVSSFLLHDWSIGFVTSVI